MKRNYLLLTPGPLSTSETVREAMLQDWCTWDKDYNEGIVTPIRKGLLAIAGLDEVTYTDVLLQGSGTYCVEATIGAAVKPTDKLLILANGAYGKRMAQIADYYHINYVLVSLHETELVTGEVARRALDAHPDVTHLSMVHSETTTGLLNPIEEVAEVLKGRNITFIVDAMSSFGGIPIDIRKLDIDFLVSSVNKSMHNGRPWKRVEANGVSPLPRMSCGHFIKPCKNWNKKEESQHGMHAISKIIELWSTVCVPWDSRHYCRMRRKDLLSHLSSIRKRISISMLFMRH